jgi:hypothetical protein
MKLGWVAAGALIFAGAAAAMAFLAVRLSAEEATAVAPAAHEVTFPEDYRKWVFVGASTGLSYSERKAAPESEERSDPGMFHHTYLNPEAYAHFSRTGTFPEGTMLVLEVRRPERKTSIQRRGWFEGELVGLELAVKDSSRFEDGWAYFSFDEGARTARPFPRDACWSCHKEHGADDNVFTQFYPILREAKAALSDGRGSEGGSTTPD